MLARTEEIQQSLQLQINCVNHLLTRGSINKKPTRNDSPRCTAICLTAGIRGKLEAQANSLKGNGAHQSINSFYPLDGIQRHHDSCLRIWL